MNTLKEDFCEFLPKNLDPDSCWLWKGPAGNDRYGIFHCEGQDFQVHRSAAIIFGNRVILPKMELYHTCDNPLCCNPRHIRVRDKATQHTYDCMGKESMIPYEEVDHDAFM